MFAVKWMVDRKKCDVLFERFSSANGCRVSKPPQAFLFRKRTVFERHRHHFRWVLVPFTRWILHKFDQKLLTQRGKSFMKPQKCRSQKFSVVNVVKSQTSSSCVEETPVSDKTKWRTGLSCVVNGVLLSDDEELRRWCAKQNGSNMSKNCWKTKNWVFVFGASSVEMCLRLASFSTTFPSGKTYT